MNDIEIVIGIVLFVIYAFLVISFFMKYTILLLPVLIVLSMMLSIVITTRIMKIMIRKRDRY
jgi:predicted MFS family arabinose efflux permease